MKLFLKNLHTLTTIGNESRFAEEAFLFTISHCHSPNYYMPIKIDSVIDKFIELKNRLLICYGS